MRGERLTLARCSETLFEKGNEARYQQEALRTLGNRFEVLMSLLRI
jgi:hypothetical protein